MALQSKRILIKRILWVFIPAVVLFVCGTFGLSYYLNYRLAHPAKSQLYGSPRDFQIILQRPVWSDEKWKNPDGTQSMGWFLSQNKPAPVIILNHGYGTNRSELLTLSFELYKAGFHILMYDLRGHGESPVHWSGLGTYEKDDLIAAIKFLKGMKTSTNQDLIDGHIGLYGVDLGGYTALAAASEDPMIKAVAVDSVCADVNQFANYRLKTMAGDNKGWVNLFTDSSMMNKIFALTMQVYQVRGASSKSLADVVSAYSERKYLYIVGKENDLPTNATRQLYEMTKGTKELAEMEKTRLNRLYTEDSSVYDARVTKFFSESIPATPLKDVAKK
jgi:pimeloyl-ACP methyl ester carboxylesterase